MVKEERKVGRKRGRKSTTDEDIETVNTLWIVVANRTILKGEEITFHNGEGYTDFFNNGICLFFKCFECMKPFLYEHGAQ